MNIWSIKNLLALALGTTLVTTASAEIFSGSFAGIAYDSRTQATGPQPGNFDGQTVRGTFWFDTSNLPAPDETGSDYSVTYVAPPTLLLTFKVPGHSTVSFDGSNGDSSLIEARSDASGKSVNFISDWSYIYSNAGLQLAGNLFDGVDIGTLHAGAVDLTGSSAYFFADRDFGASIRLTNVQIGSVSSVPEPHTWASLLGGLLLLSTVQKTSRSAANTSLGTRS